MNDEEFTLLLQRATDNDNESVRQIIQIYEKLIYKTGYINGRLDEDCRACIENKLITAIKRFKI